MPEVGQTIAGKYRVVRTIGAGGMGTVVAATHLQLGTQLALKFLNDKIKDSPSSIERFTREARACAQLKSEHICRVTDFGLEDGVPYIAMELLDGIDLARLLDTGRVDTGVAVDFVLQACTGLAEAHALGIVHRDLKPGNLFLTRRPDGMPLIKVLDFGVAKIPVDEDDHALTQTSHIIGSPGYMAPEQLRSAKAVDQRADVWALGVILYELISTRHPFFAEAVTEIAVKIAMDDPPPLDAAPAGLATIVMRCLEKEPDARFHDVGELAAALAPFALHDRAAAAVAMRALVESAETYSADPKVPTVTSSQGASPAGATKPDSPRNLPQPDTTPQHSAGVIDRKPTRRRAAWWVVAGMAVVGTVGVVIVVGRDPPITPVEHAPIVAVPDAARPEERPSAIADAPALRSKLEINVVGAVDATISVDGVVWGEGKRIAREVDHGEHSITVRATGREAVNARVVLTHDDVVTLTVPPKTLRDNHSIEPPSSNSDRGVADAAVREGRAAMQRRGLLDNDLGNAGINVQNAIVGAQQKQEWAKLRTAGLELIRLANAVKIDRPFISRKQAWLTARLRRANPSSASYEQLIVLQNEASAAINIGEYEIANTKLNLAANLVLEARDPQGPSDDP